MAAGDRERIGRGLELIAAGLGPFVDRRMTAARGPGWLAGWEARDSERFGGRRGYSLGDARFLLRVVTEERDVFRQALPRPGLSLASEIREAGNKYGHEFDASAFTPAETGRALSAIAQLLRLAGANAEAAEAQRLAGGAPAPPPGSPRPSGPAGPPPPRPGAAYPPSAGGGVPKPAIFAGAGCLALVVVGLVIAFVVGVVGHDDAGGDGDGGGGGGGGHHGKYSGVKNGTELGSYQGIKLSPGRYLDFTDDPRHPKENGGDLKFNAATTELRADRVAVVRPGGKAGYQACRDDTTAQWRALDADTLPGRSLCVTRDDGVIGLVQVRRFVDEPDTRGIYVVVDLTAWKGPAPK
ncbi:Swt1 family HEPN domain-containing protein [Actinomadura verrucosospora]|uniref:Swt1-like HEPN domain-containing protein n=1 Tax=Actinomadura verrucosospora TaxID=46165 RepID=A0A7D3ZK11_ACTVE|nr:Swt1 family HEPN domain-containing protein [Actinomadura verrucosospora]QKG21801.1 hypothetical protein ACTIVE_3439 [Actinomadura verrucosospora]